MVSSLFSGSTGSDTWGSLYQQEVTSCKTHPPCTYSHPTHPTHLPPLFPPRSHPTPPQPNPHATPTPRPTSQPVPTPSGVIMFLGISRLLSTSSAHREARGSLSSIPSLSSRDGQRRLRMDASSDSPGEEKKSGEHWHSG